MVRVNVCTRKLRLQAFVHTHTHTHAQNVLRVGTLINEVFGSLGPAAVLGK